MTPSNTVTAATAPVLLLADAYTVSCDVGQRATAIASALGVSLVISGRQLPATWVQPQLVVLGEVHPTAPLVTSLIDKLGVPVLVAREPRPSGGLLAGSDLEHPMYPVLNESARYARLLGKRVTFLHNARRVSAISGRSRTQDIGREHARAMQAILRKLAMHARCDATAVVVREVSTADAMIGVADLDDADIVAVGHRWQPGSRASRDSSEDLTASIIERCSSSVLVVPFGAST